MATGFRRASESVRQMIIEEVAEKLSGYEGNGITFIA